MGIESSTQKENLKSTEDLNAQDRARINALHDAVREGNLDRFKSLLTGEEDAKITDEDGKLPLHIAAENGEITILRNLLQFKSTVGIEDSQMRTPLFLAAANGELDCVDELLNAGAYVNTQDKYGMSPMHLAAQRGYVSIAKKLLDHKAEVNIPDSRKVTPIHVARPECVDVLLNHGADVTAECFSNGTPLHFAVERGSDDTVKKFLKVKPPPLRKSTRSSKADQKARRKKADYVDIQDGRGFTALHIASQGLKLNLALQLLDAGARWDLKDNRNKTMMWHLIISLSKKHPRDTEIPLLTRILERTNDSTGVDDEDKTATRWAIECWIHQGFDFECMKLFITTQKEINMEDENGLTLLNYFTDFRHYEAEEALQVIRCCIERGDYLISQDCDNIKNHPPLQDGILRDVELCTKSIANKFNLITLKKFDGYLQGAKQVAPVEALRMRPGRGVWRITEEDVKSEIGRNGYCDVSRLVTTSLSKCCIESYCNWAPTRKHK